MDAETILVSATAIACIIWVYLLFFNGWFWLSNENLEDANGRLEWPEVVVVIPARDEVDTIGDVVHAHLASDYPGKFSLIVVDDQSTDGTGDIVRAFKSENVHVVPGTDLPVEWSGKLWAVHNGLQAADELAPGADFVLLTDADIVHAPQTLRKLVSKALDDQRSLVSVMAQLDARGFWGSLLMPAFIFFFEKLYPFKSSNNPQNKVAGAAGGCMLVNKAVLKEIGGVESIQGALIDDCSLAAKIKDVTGAKRSIWLGYDKGVVSLRDNRELKTIWKMVARTAFTQLRFSTLALVGATIGMLLTYVVAPLAFFMLPIHGSGMAFTLGTWAWMSAMVAYLPTLLRYQKPPFWAVLLPLSAALYMAMTITSALRHWRGQGGAWKGRTYS